MQSDSFILEQAMSSNDIKLPFLKKDLQILSDLNNGSYQSNQVIFETTGISNSTNWLDYSNGLILLPTILAITGTSKVGAGADTVINFQNIKSDYMAGLKNSYTSLISSISIDLGGTNLVQITNNIAQFINFKLHCKMSSEEEQKWSDMIGYYADSPNSWCYNNAPSAQGEGLCNNVNVDGLEVAVAGASLGSTAFNKGFYRRQLGSLSSSNNANRTVFSAGTDSIVKDNGQDYVVNSATAKVYYLHAFIRLKDLLLYNGIPLLKSAYFKITLNINQCSFTVTKNADSVMTMSNGNFGGSINPVMVSASGIAVPTSLNTAVTATGPTKYTADPNAYIQAGMAPFDNVSGAGATTFIFNYKLGVCKVDTYTHQITTCKLYVPSYVLSPTVEKLYLTQNSGQHKHIYSDVSLQIIEVGKGASITANLGQRSRLRRVVCVPILSASENGALGQSPLYSPFTTEGATTSPLLPYIRNFQIDLAGQQVYKQQLTNVFEHFLYDSSLEGLNGGLVDGLSSGKFNKVALENSYGYIDSQIRLREEDFNTPIQVNISFTSICLKAFQLYCFLEYEKNVVFDLATGSAVSVQI